jgi:LPS-assembly lipoprotein
MRLLAGLALAALVLPACTVRPLYSSAPLAATGARVSADLSSIAIKSPATRYGQEVRNHLVFLFNRGKGEPVQARYSLALNVIRSQESSAAVQIADRNEPSSATITLIADYTLIEIATGDQILKGVRQIASSYDVPRQEFANVRAERDAENRAARELAEVVNLAVSQGMVAPITERVKGEPPAPAPAK